MSNIGNMPNGDVPEPVLPDHGGSDAIGRPIDESGIGNDLPEPSDGASPLGEPDPTRSGADEGAIANDFA